MKPILRSPAFFLVATFAWTWACYAPIVVSGRSPYEMPWMALLIAGGMGPSLIAVVLVLATGERTDRTDFFNRLVDARRIPLGWLALIALIFPAIYACAIGLDLALGGAWPGLEQLRALQATPLLWPLVLFISFLSGPWSEEFGWRGYVLDPIVRRFGPLPGAVLLGLLWGIWHLPLYGMPATWHGQMGFRLEGFWTFMALSVGLSLLMTRIHLATQRSILAALLVHFAANIVSQLVAPVSDRVEVLRTLLIVAVGVGVWLGDRGPQTADFHALASEQA